VACVEYRDVHRLKSVPLALRSMDSWLVASARCARGSDVLML